MGVFQKLTDGRIGGFSRAILSESLTDDTNDVLFNVTRSRNISRSSSITEHAIEDGAPITDNKKNNTVGVSMDILLADQRDLLSIGAFSKSKKIQERREQLIKWFDDATILFYIFDQVIDPVLIKDLSEAGNSGEGKGLSMAIALKKIVIAKAITVVGVQDKGFTETRDDGESLELS